MNNSAFRSLVSGQSSATKSSASNDENSTFKKPNVALGSRIRSSIPMTPRSLPGQRQNAHSDFARQVADATRSSANSGSEGPPLKKFKTSAAPKGTRLASGYTDRASLMRSGDTESTTDVDDKEKRLKALEDLYKLQQIDEETFERLKGEIGVGGDVSSTHLVRGLDWKLLERVRRGEDVTKANQDDSGGDENDNIDVDAEFDKVLEQEVTAKEGQSDLTNNEQQQSGGNGQMSTSKSLTRDEILQRLKQSRQKGYSPPNPVTTQAPVLNDKFKKIPSKQTAPKKEKFIETIQGRRREVLLITNPDGTTKRKTRWLDSESSQTLPVVAEQSPDEVPQDLEGETKQKKIRRKAQEILGMDVPADIAAREAARKAAEAAALAEEDDDDIFQGVGDDYDPLGDIKSDATDEDDDAGNVTAPKDNTEQIEHDSDLQPPKKRNYFSTTTTDEEYQNNANPMNKDPTILAALKRAAEIRKREEDGGSSNVHGSSSGEHEADDKSRAFLAKLRERERQDDADLDMGFGGSRFDEDDEDDGGGNGLLDFNHEGDEDGDDSHTGKKGKGGGRKRGSKKKRGDKNNFADVMGVIEGRKKQ